MAFEIAVDKQKCIGCQACVSTCPSMFKMVGGKSEPKRKKVDNAGCAKQAEEICPVNAITVKAI